MNTAGKSEENHVEKAAIQPGIEKTGSVDGKGKEGRQTRQETPAALGAIRPEAMS